MICVELESNKNSAFENDAEEVARILEELAQDLRRNGARDRALKDINGNTCGQVWVRDDE